MHWTNTCIRIAKNILEAYYLDHEIKVLSSSNNRSIRVTIDNNQDILISLPPLNHSTTEIENYIKSIIRRTRGEEDSSEFMIFETLGGIFADYYKTANILCVPHNGRYQDSISYTTIINKDNETLIMKIEIVTITNNDSSNNVVFSNEQRTINTKTHESTSVYDLPEAEWQKYIKTAQDLYPNPYNEPIWKTALQYEGLTHYYGRNIFAEKESNVIFLMIFGIWTPIPKQWIRVNADKFPPDTRNELNIIYSFGYI